MASDAFAVGFQKRDLLPRRDLLLQLKIIRISENHGKNGENSGPKTLFLGVFSGV
jgi:hypothetical protein